MANKNNSVTQGMSPAMTCVGKAKHGALYEMANSEVLVLHLYGTPHQMGYAQGVLLNKKIVNFYGEFIQFLVDFFVKSPPGRLQSVPACYRVVLAPQGMGSITKETVEKALAAVVKNTKPYTPAHFTEEAKGIADGIVDHDKSQLQDSLQLQYSKQYEIVLGISMFGELVRAGCSIIGANKTATKTGKVIQLRALDFGFPEPLVGNPLLKVYHPNSIPGVGHEFLTLGWVGFIGALTSYSRYTAVSEKVWAWRRNQMTDPQKLKAPNKEKLLKNLEAMKTLVQKDNPKEEKKLSTQDLADLRTSIDMQDELPDYGQYSSKGIPFNFLLRDIAQFDESIRQTRARLNNVHRTCAIYIGVGTNEGNEFSTFGYSLDSIREFTWDSPFPGFAPQSPQHHNIKDVMYINKTEQPNKCDKMGVAINNALSNKQGGASYISVEDMKDICREEQTGTVHIAIFDFAENTVDIAIAIQDSKGWADAWQTENDAYIKLDANALFDLRLDGHFVG